MDLADLNDRFSWMIRAVFDLEPLAVGITHIITVRAVAGICDDVVVGVCVQAKSSAILQRSWQVRLRIRIRDRLPISPWLIAEYAKSCRFP